MNIIINYLSKSGLLFFTFFLMVNCDNVQNVFHKIKKDAYQKRYGTDLDELQKKEEWEKDIAEFEKIISKKIEAGAKAAHLYRKIGEAYGRNKSYDLCIENLKKAIGYGYDEPSVFFSLGLCEGNLARMNNWPPEQTKEAEQTFLKVLNMDNEYHKAKYELGLIYFYGNGRNSSYSILSDIITISQKQFQEKAIALISEYQFYSPAASDSYFALANIYTFRREFQKAISQMETLSEMKRKYFPDNFKRDQDYINAQLNLKKLNNMADY